MSEREPGSRRGEGAAFRVCGDEWLAAREAMGWWHP